MRLSKGPTTNSRSHSRFRVHPDRTASLVAIHSRPRTKSSEYPSGESAQVSPQSRDPASRTLSGLSPAKITDGQTRTVPMAQLDADESVLERQHEVANERELRIYVSRPGFRRVRLPRMAAYGGSS